MGSGHAALIPQSKTTSQSTTTVAPQQGPSGTAAAPDLEKMLATIMAQAAHAMPIPHMGGNQANGNANDFAQQRYDERTVPREIVAEPGRETLVEAQAVNQAMHPAGSPLHGPACNNNAKANLTAAQCFLSPDERTTMLSGFQGRVLSAQMCYLGALAELRVDELLKKEPEKSDFLVELLIEVIATVAVPGLGRAVKLLRSGAAKALEHTIGDTDALQTALRSSAGEKKIEAAIKSAVSMGKKSVSTLAKGTDPDAHDKKTANVAFIDILKNQAPLIYQHIREDAVSDADDATVAILFKAFDAEMGHTTDEYKKALQAKLDRFEKSHVGEIGLTENREKVGLELDAHGSLWWQWDTRTFWVTTPQGRRLGLYRRDHQVPLMDSGNPGLRDLDERLHKQVEVENAARDYRFMRYVPIEFEETALAMHKAQWGDAPLERTAQAPEEFATAGVTI